LYIAAVQMLKCVGGAAEAPGVGLLGAEVGSGLRESNPINTNQSAITTDDCYGIPLRFLIPEAE
jgi:hypothetical protein